VASARLKLSTVSANVPVDEVVFPVACLTIVKVDEINLLKIHFYL